MDFKLGEHNREQQGHRIALKWPSVCGMPRWELQKLSFSEAQRNNLAIASQFVLPLHIYILYIYIQIYHLGIQIAQIAQHSHGAFSDRFGIGQSHWWMELSHGSMACNSAQGQKGQKGQTECDKVLLGTASVVFRGAIFGFSDFSSKLRADGHEFWASTGAAGWTATVAALQGDFGATGILCGQTLCQFVPWGAGCGSFCGSIPRLVAGVVSACFSLVIAK